MLRSFWRKEGLFLLGFLSPTFRKKKGFSAPFLHLPSYKVPSAPNNPDGPVACLGEAYSATFIANLGPCSVGTPGRYLRSAPSPSHRLRSQSLATDVKARVCLLCGEQPQLLLSGKQRAMMHLMGVECSMDTLSLPLSSKSGTY